MKKQTILENARFKSLQAVPNVHENKTVSHDFLYWKSLQFPVTVSEFGAISNIDIQQRFPYNIAVSSATRVQIYNEQTIERIKSFSRFHDTVYGASYRSDGNLLVAGNEDGNVRLFDTEGRVPLRIFKGHSRPVHVSKFCNDMARIFTASDDKTVCVWDVATEKAVRKYSDHEDYIRSGAVSKSSTDIIATGSYDHTVKLYDTRAKASILSIDHGQPVESILVYPSGSLLLSAGGNTIKVWDMLQGGKMLTSVTHHHKTITCMTFNHDCSRFLSGSLDRHVKIYDVTTYSVVHNIDYPGPILSMAVSHEDKTLAVGMVDKTISFRHRKEKQVEEHGNSDQRKKVKNRTNRLFYMPGKDYAPDKDDIVIHNVQMESLSHYDKYFRKFEHSQALDAALLHHIPPEVTVVVLEELIRRDRIKSALAGRTNKKLTELLKFIIKNITKISFASTLLDVTDVLIDIYYPELQEHPEPARSLFIKLRDTVKNEAELHKQMYSLMGCMDAILASNSQAVRQTKAGGLERSEIDNITIRV